jgi:prevent-host-death family protein
MLSLAGAHVLTVAEATRRGVTGLVADAEDGEAVVLTRRNEPVAAVLSMRRLAELEQVAADLRDLALVLARVATDTGHRTSLDDVLAAFGHTRESIAAARLGPEGDD